jgi:hypothetical protein
MSASAPLEARVQRLESIEAIRRLVATYALGADRKNDPAIMRTLFCDDASWESDGIARLEGADVIAAGLADIARDLVLWSLHFMVSPLIDVEEGGEHATCHWYLWELCTMTGDDGVARDTWLGGWYHSELRRDAAGWRFLRVKLDLRLVSANDAPWQVKKTDAAVGA